MHIFSCWIVRALTAIYPIAHYPLLRFLTNLLWFCCTNRVWTLPLHCTVTRVYVIVINVWLFTCNTCICCNLICSCRLLDRVCWHTLFERSARPSNECWCLPGGVFKERKLWWSWLEWYARGWWKVLSAGTLDNKQTKLPTGHYSIRPRQDLWR